MSRSTRSQTDHYVLGQPSPLPNTQLPSRGDVANYVKLLLQGKGVRRKRTEGTIFRDVAAQVVKIWSDEGIPTHDTYYVSKRVKVECYDFLQKANNISKFCRQSSEGEGSVYYSRLFDIAKCKCRAQNDCNCPGSCKIPTEEWAFVCDQRAERKLTLGGIDRATTVARSARLQRSESRQGQFQRPEADAAPGPSGPYIYDYDSATSDDDAMGETDESVPAASTTERNTDDLSLAALAADRYGVSYRAAAKIINGFQQGIGRINEQDGSCIIDPKKMWRARQQIRQQTANENAEDILESGLTSLYFDRRRQNMRGLYQRYRN